MLVERDFIIRLLKQLAEFIARALKLAKAGQKKEALELLQTASGGLLGLEYRALSLMDVKSAVEILGTAPRAMAFARLVQAMAGVTEGLASEMHREHARDLLGAILERYPTHDEARQVLNELA